MNHERWQRVKDLFEQAMDRTEGERAAFLDDACAGDAALRGEVDRLLRGDEDAGEFLASGAPSFGSAAILGTPLVDDIEAGDRIGDYQLIERIGTGGFGVVFRAQQESPLRREVAVKVIKLGMDTRKVVARFAAERQALAMMEHPHIARVYDAGATDGGRPYFVMELVRGAPITTYCDDHALTLRARLALFADVCRAVQHAHQKGVIHRDIKPSNVMVTGQNGDAAPKVIDFGIAKAIDRRLTDETVTDERHPIGTPEYMSPEQASPGVDIDTRSDVYSLGVLLYQLLTGTTPFDSQRLRRSPGNEVQRILREEEPPKPSTRLLGLPRLRVRREVASDAPTVPHAASSPGLPRGETSLDDVARHRGVDVHRLQRFVRGELDWIVMKSLEKDRSRRYATANDLAADVDRFLNHEPVVASPPSTTYRVRKFVRRHRGFVASAAAIFAIVAAASVTSTVFGVNADRQRGIAERESRLRDAADQFFLDEMFGAIDVDARGHLDIKVREVLDGAAREVGEVDEPEVEALTRTRIGRVYFALGLYKQAREQLEVARRLYRDVLGEESLDAADTMFWLGRVLAEQGDYEGAKAELARVIELRTALVEHEDADTAHVLDVLADIERTHGDLETATELNRRAVEIFQRVLPPGEASAEMASALASRAWHLEQTGHREDAAMLMADAVVIARKRLGPEHSQLATILNAHGRLLGTLRRFDEGALALKEAREMRLQVLPEGHPSITQSAADLGALRLQAWCFAAAEGLLREAWLGYVSQFGEEHKYTAQARLLVGQAIVGQRDPERYAEALAMIEPALAVFQQRLGRSHWQTLNAEIEHASLIARLGRRDEAERVLIEVERTLAEQNLPPSLTLKAIAQRAEVYADWGRDEEARALYADVLAGYRDLYGPHDPQTIDSWVEQASLDARLGRVEEAEADLRDAFVILEEHNLIPALSAKASARLAELYRDTGRLDLADTWTRRMAVFASQSCGVAH